MDVCNSISYNLHSYCNFNGAWHRKTQLRVEATIIAQANPVLAKMFRTLLDVQTGKANEEEIKKFRNMLQEIEKNE